MKRILLLSFVLILVLSANGQEKRIPIKPNYKPYYSGKIIFGESTFTPYTGSIDSAFSAYVLSIFVKTYSRYEKECYADSTFVPERKDPMEPTVFTFVNGKWKTVDATLPSYWAHRTPTFPGFLQWLEGQMK